jgi:hypothetical protein
MTVVVMLTTALSGITAGQEAEQTRRTDEARDVRAFKGDGSAVKPPYGAARDEFSQITDGSLLGLPKDLLEDQQAIWTAPFRLRLSDTQWLVPLGGITAGMLVTEASYSRHLSHNPSTTSHYQTLSTAGLAALLGGGAGMWALGKVKHNSHWSETGFLAGEAALNSLAVVEGLKYTLQRSRPFEGDGSGSFFQGGTSFPSEHAAAAWSVAGVVAHEYPGTLTKVLAYGLASMVSFSRVHARQHFPSDVLVGTVIGNLVAESVYTRRHDPELGGGEWRSLGQVFGGNVPLKSQGSPYVPVDSWVYPQFDRLIALGVIKTGFLGMRPWTRRECARLLNEAGERLERDGQGGIEAENALRALEGEFRQELESAGGEGRLRAQIESVYSRVTGISGQPLTDGNHFAQTLVNDYGRPFQEGVNAIEGISAWSTTGHLVAYVRAEYQHAPSAPAPSLSARQFIASVDNVPGLPPATPIAGTNRVELLDAYFGVSFNNWQLTFGRQTLWWGSAEGGPFIFSDDAAPVSVLRLSRLSPFQLPWIFGLLGPIRVEWILGQLDGHQFVFQTDTGIVGQFGQSISRQPFLQGQKISLKPSSNFEFSVATTAVFAGGPTPLTFHTLAKSYSLSNLGAHQGSPEDPGDRRSSVDFTYRVPGLRQWLTFYGDAFTEDEFSPLGYPRKSAFRGGLYFPKLPKLPKLDLRVEGGTTVPVDFLGCNGCFYVNGRYPDGSYTNRGSLMGSYLGRASQGEQAWSTYWLSSRNKIQFSYRHQTVSSSYLPQGGTLNDGSVSADFWIGNDVQISPLLQYEHWSFPVVTPLPQSNITASVQITFWPRHWAVKAD